MRAVAVNAYDDAPSLMELPDPRPEPGQVLIRIEAAGVNPMDRVIAAGGFQAMAPAQFPLVLGADMAGIVEAVGTAADRFGVGEEVFGQLLVPPFGSTGTYAERVAASEDAPLARVPPGLDPISAAALPTPGGTALIIVESLEPIAGKTLVLVGAAGGIGSFATQLAASAGAHVIAVARAEDAERLRTYGATEVIDYTAASVPDEVRRTHPDGIDALIDVVSDAGAFATLASLVRPGGTAVTTQYVADTEALASNGVTAVNFRLELSSDVLERLADAVVNGRAVVPPIAQIKLEDVPTLNGKPPPDGKSVIALS
ncbi:MAG TPA: NADP-dependent oxidoreductase [Solirubrobacteraceae bacterium]|nr:NADP-dependent oxidoreductase [Solirubrobacteraceae bacterium]